MDEYDSIYIDEQCNQETLIVNQGDVFMVTNTNVILRGVVEIIKLEIIKLNDYSKIEMYKYPCSDGTFNIFKDVYVKRVKLMDDGVDP